MAKPKDWKALSEEQKRQVARDLLVTVRGHCLLGKALAYAITELRKVDADSREYSTIEDMEILSLIFDPCYITTKMDLIKKARQNRK